METPTEYQLRAALLQARLLDEAGSQGSAVDLAQRVTATEGIYPAESLRDAHRLLVGAGLISALDDRFRATEALLTVAGLDDESAINLLRRLFERRTRHAGQAASDEEDRALIGSIGEDIVVQMARDGLVAGGRRDLADQVQRVSLVDDGLGYDVQAPTLDGRLRLMEVKSSTSASSATSFSLFLSRNEYEVGVRNDRRWSIVACRISGDRAPSGSEVLGWAPIAALEPYLPDDGNGRWTEALVRLPRSVLTAGLPPAV